MIFRISKLGDGCRFHAVHFFEGCVSLFQGNLEGQLGSKPNFKGNSWKSTNHHRKTGETPLGTVDGRNPAPPGMYKTL